ncbi:beta-ketoacyl synthase N-terminal-like domain-containing protein [Streptomyces sp. NPDC058157]|uniref:beta-ketoacyl synthase N-terminal-like domain-containing protein n=1 Tax=Streptomyces sp. NPDC058157 TaxID=3346360 RepID=UPI0036ED4B66
MVAETFEAVAVVRVGCRPSGGVASPEGLRDLLVIGTDAVGTLPARCFDAAAFTAPAEAGGAPRPGTTYSDAGRFLRQDLTLFDAVYFGISPAEASRIDLSSGSCRSAPSRHWTVRASPPVVWPG